MSASLFRDLMPFRAFVAVAAPPQPGLVALLDELGSLGADLRCVMPENLHFTLAFLGDVPDGSEEPIAAALHDAARGLAPSLAQLRGVGAFPSARRPRVVWVGVADPRPLVTLATRVREALAAAGFRGDDKDFRAHLTLARVRSDRGADKLAGFLRAHAQDEPGELAVREATLYRSVLSPHGPTYEALARAPLGA